MYSGIAEHEAVLPVVRDSSSAVGIHNNDAEDAEYRSCFVKLFLFTNLQSAINRCIVQYLSQIRRIYYEQQCKIVLESK